MPATVVDAVSHPYPCEHGCFEALTLDERAQGIDALYRFDDAMRGWGQQVIWDLAAPWLWRVQQQLEGARWVAVRDDACIYARLVGFCLHELVHALSGDPSRPNYGMPVGLPYGVPEDVAPGGEADYLRPFNQVEARAWVGGAPLARRLFGIEWQVVPARDVGTYGLVGGNAVVEVPAGYRPVPHYDRQHHAGRYYRLARELEDEARAWYTAERLDELAARFEDAEARGRAKRPRPFPAARELARKKPGLPGRNDLCLCGSGQKWKKCCGRAA
jgi:SEC-C motif